jgi:hypothetical protein
MNRESKNTIQYMLNQNSETSRMAQVRLSSPISKLGIFDQMSPMLHHCLSCLPSSPPLPTLHLFSLSVLPAYPHPIPTHMSSLSVMSFMPVLFRPISLSSLSPAWLHLPYQFPSKPLLFSLKVLPACHLPVPTRLSSLSVLSCLLYSRPPSCSP